MSEKILTATSSFAKFDQRAMDLFRQADMEVVHNPHGRKLTKPELIGLLSGITGLIAGLETIDREVMQQSDLKVISRCGVGMSNVDLKAAEDLGIAVFSTPDAPTEAVAELTLAGILSCLRRIPTMNQDLHNGQWSRQNGMQLKGKSVLIVGLGRIGQRVAKLLQPFDVNILIADPYVEDEANVTLREGLERADIITLHLSGGECLLGEKEFALMKEGVVICNAARGTLIDEAQLIKGLESGRVSSCWIDTFADEPYSGQLRDFSQAILTPHVGSFTRECRAQMEYEAAYNLVQALRTHRGGAVHT